MTTPAARMADLMFDHDITLGVVGHLTPLFDGHGTTPVADEYEPGMWQVRLDPTDPEATNGWVAVAGTTTNGMPGWVLIPTVATTDAKGTRWFMTADDDNPSRYPHLIDLYLNLNAPIDTVAHMIYTYTFATLTGMGDDEINTILGR